MEAPPRNLEPPKIFLWLRPLEEACLTHAVKAEAGPRWVSCHLIGTLRQRVQGNEAAHWNKNSHLGEKQPHKSEQLVANTESRAFVRHHLLGFADAV